MHEGCVYWCSICVLIGDQFVFNRFSTSHLFHMFSINPSLFVGLTFSSATSFFHQLVMTHSIKTLAMLMSVLCCFFLNASSAPTCSSLGCLRVKATRTISSTCALSSTHALSPNALPEPFYDGLPDFRSLREITPLLMTNDVLR